MSIKCKSKIKERQMPSRKVVKNVALVVYHHDFNDVNFLTEVIRQTLGYEYTQAFGCASIIIDKGQYIVKTFKSVNKDIAEIYLQLFLDQEVPAKLIPV